MLLSNLENNSLSFNEMFFEYSQHSRRNRKILVFAAYLKAQ